MTFKNPTDEGGPYAQVSRLGMPLVNEVVIGLKDKNLFNSSEPKNDVQFLDSRSGGGGGGAGVGGGGVAADGAARSRPSASEDIPAPDDAPRDVDPDEIPF